MNSESRTGADLLLNLVHLFNEWETATQKNLFLEEIGSLNTEWRKEVLRSGGLEEETWWKLVKYPLDIETSREALYSAVNEKQ